MSIGDKWQQFGMGAMDKVSSFKLLDAFYDAGGNFIDTANAYQDESSEEFIGEWMEQRGIRDQIVVATKVRMTNSRSGAHDLSFIDLTRDYMDAEIGPICSTRRTSSARTPT